MKNILFLVFLMLALLITSCATSEEACMIECGSIDLKNQNKCQLDHENDYSRNLECSSKADQENSKRVGRCLGNL